MAKVVDFISEGSCLANISPVHDLNYNGVSANLRLPASMIFVVEEAVRYSKQRERTRCGEAS